MYYIYAWEMYLHRMTQTNVFSSQKVLCSGSSGTLVSFLSKVVSFDSISARETK